MTPAIITIAQGSANPTQPLACARPSLALPRGLAPVLSQAVAKGSDLSTVLAFMPIVHVDKDIIQSILHAIPGECSSLTERFGGNVDEQRHHLGMRVIELCQNFLDRFRFTPAHLAIVELPPRFDIAV